MKLSDLDTKEKEPLKVHQPGARAYLVSRNFISDKEIVSELMGNYPGNANKISVKTIKTEEGNHLIVAGNDGGLKEDDIEKLLGCFIRTHNTLEHSEHGQGSRAAGSSLTREAKKSKFCIVSRQIIKGINQFNGVIFENGVDYYGYNTIYALKMKELDAKDVFNSFQTPIDDSGDVSKWICCCKEDALKKNENGELDVQSDIQMRYSKQIMEKEVEIYCQDKILKIEHPFINNKLSDTLKIWKAKITGEAGICGGEFDLFEIKGKNYKYVRDGQKHYTPVREKVIHMTEKPLFEFKASIFHPTPEEREKIGKEYSMIDSKSKKNGNCDRKLTDYNGVYCLKKNVLLSTTSLEFKGIRKAGTSPDKVYIMAIQPTGEGENTGIQTNVQKDRSICFHDSTLIGDKLMRMYYELFKNEYKTTDTDLTNTITDNTRNTSSQSRDGGARSEVAAQSTDTTMASSRSTGERESKRQRTEEDSTSQLASSTQPQLNKKDYTYFYLFTMINPATHEVDESWKVDDKPIYKFGRTTQDEFGRMKQHKCHHPILKIKLIFFSKNRGPPSRETTIKTIAIEKNCHYRDEFLYGDKKCIMDIIKTELKEETPTNKPYTQDELDKIMDEIYRNGRFNGRFSV